MRIGGEDSIRARDAASRLAQRPLGSGPQERENQSCALIPPIQTLESSRVPIKMWTQSLSIGVVLLVNLVVLILVLRLLFKVNTRMQAADSSELPESMADLRDSLAQSFGTATADMAMRLESTKGDLRQQVSDRLGEGFHQVRTLMEGQFGDSRREQTQGLRDARSELTNSLALTTSQLKAEIEGLSLKTVQSLEAIRDRVDAKLMAISGEVQQKLDQ